MTVEDIQEEASNARPNNKVSESNKLDVEQSNINENKKQTAQKYNTDDDEEDESEDEYDTWEPTYQNLPSFGHMTENSGFSEAKNLSDRSSELAKVIPSSTDDDSRVSVEIRDLAGGEKYHITHPRFMSPEAVYIITFDISNTGDSLQTSRFELRHWLKTILCCRKKDARWDSLAEQNPPILIVGTHKDKYLGNDERFKKILESEVEQAVNSEEIKRHIRKYFFVSNVEDSYDMFDLLRTEIISAAEETNTWV